MFPAYPDSIAMTPPKNGTDDASHAAAAADLDETRRTLPLVGEDRRPRRIAFVIDDSEDAQEHFGQALADAGYRVVAARDGREALDLLLEHPIPTAIILDLIMPKFTGFELLDIVSSYSRLKEVPILVVTASCDEVVLNVPFGRCLRKPIDGPALVEALEDLVEQKRLQGAGSGSAAP